MDDSENGTPTRGGKVITPPPDLPDEIFLEIAEQLTAAYHALRSLASLNIVCHCVHNATLPALYRTVIRSAGDSASLKEDGKVLCSNVVPKGWRYTKYLFLDQTTFDKLNAVDVGRGWTTSDPITSLFPRLVFLSLRVPRPPSCDWRTSYKAKIRDPLVIDSSIHVFKPISPSSLLRLSVIGTRLRQTSIADAVFQRPVLLSGDAEAGNILPSSENLRSVVLGPGSTRVVDDNIRWIQFHRDAYFVQDSHPVELEPACGVLEVDTDTLGGDHTLGSRSRCIASGLLTLLGPRAVTGVHPDNLLPKMKLLGDVAFAFALMEELLSNLPLRATLHVLDTSSTPIAEKRSSVAAIAERYHRQWESIGLPTSVGYDARFFHLTCPQPGRVTGKSTFTAILVRSPNIPSDSKEGFYHIQRAPEYNGGLYKVLFHQTVPEHTVTVINVWDTDHGQR